MKGPYLILGRTTIDCSWKLIFCIIPDRHDTLRHPAPETEADSCIKKIRPGNSEPVFNDYKTYKFMMWCNANPSLCKLYWMNSPVWNKGKSRNINIRSVLDLFVLRGRFDWWREVCFTFILFLNTIFLKGADMLLNGRWSYDARINLTATYQQTR